MTGELAWFKKMRSPAVKGQKKASVPTGLWKKCPACHTASLSEDVTRALETCPACGHHFRVSARQRLDHFLDKDSFEELASELAAQDPLEFTDSKPYAERIERTAKQVGENDAFVLGQGRLYGRAVITGAFEFGFMGGSMGSVVGEKVTQAFELGLEQERPVVIFSASGGARMQEGVLSLMQMAKTSAAIGRFRRARMPYVSVLTDPTTGGVAASFALLGDVIVAEPGALIGFAGPRVIEQTIREQLPEGFQRSEFLLEHGMVDMVVPRLRLRERLSDVIEMLCGA